VKRTSSSSGAATRTSKHRDLIGGMSRLVELAHRISRMFGVYFSIVRRSAACASRVSESASLMITTRTTGSVLWWWRGGTGQKGTLEALLGVQVDLLRLRNFFE
jgi:hypothetical protein